MTASVIHRECRYRLSGAERHVHKADKKADIHIVVEESTLKAAKIRCIQEDLVLSDAITQLLREWVADKAKSKRGLMMTKQRRCAIYARVSTDEQVESLELTALREFVSQRGWELKATYVDHGISSRSFRPELEKMMRDAHKRRLDVIAVWKFDRFARSMRELVFALEQFQVRGIDFVSVTQAIDTSGPMGKLVLWVPAAIAEFERELIKERVLAGMKEAQRQGKHCRRPARKFDTEKAGELRQGELSWRKLAAETGVPVHLLRARLVNKTAAGSIGGKEKRVQA